MDKDALVLPGLIFTVLIGVLNFGYSYRHNRRASYVGSVTATRLKWIAEVRDHLSRFVALIYQSGAVPSYDLAKRKRIFSEMAHHSMLLRLQLAPHAAGLDRQFQELIQSAFRDSGSWTPQEVPPRLEVLVEMGQRFLWEEWLKVKREAIYGDPYDRLPYKIRCWLDSMEKESERYILKSEQQWSEAIESGKTLEIERILAEDFVGIHWNGNHCGKAEMIARTRKEAPRFASNKLDRVTVRFFGKTALAEGEATWEDKRGQRGRFLWLDTWMRRDGRWQIVEQATVARPIR